MCTIYTAKSTYTKLIYVRKQNGQPIDFVNGKFLKIP